MVRALVANSSSARYAESIRHAPAPWCTAAGTVMEKSCPRLPFKSGTRASWHTEYYKLVLIIYLVHCSAVMYIFQFKEIEILGYRFIGYKIIAPLSTFIYCPCSR